MGFSAQVGTRGLKTWQDTQHVFFPQPWSYLKQLYIDDVYPSFMKGISPLLQGLPVTIADELL
jgi:hypothetical protein